MQQNLSQFSICLSGKFDSVFAMYGPGYTFHYMSIEGLDMGSAVQEKYPVPYSLRCIATLLLTAIGSDAYFKVYC